MLSQVSFEQWGPLRELLERCFREAVAAADPALTLPSFLPSPPAGRLLVVGAGKAARRMARAVDDHYGDEVPIEGLVVVPEGEAAGGEARRSRIEFLGASHPLPDERSVAASERILKAVSACGPDDRVLVLLSGGGSALLCGPDGITLEEKRNLTTRLLRSGATIEEMNAVRKHLSRVKGGRLALAAYPAPVTSLVLSDVVGDDLSTIASGPTVADPTVFADALAVLDRYGIEARAARRVLEAGVDGERPETPKPGDSRLAEVETILIGNNQQSLEACARVLGDAGYPAHVLSSSIAGEAREAAHFHAAVVRQVLERRQPFASPCAIISGGETTVSVQGRGRGGRNSEFGLALALALPPRAPVAALIADSDGRDGSEQNAGVLLSPTMLADFDRPLARELLGANDSYTFFADHDLLLDTGPTGTNVNDLRVILVAEQVAAESR